MNTFTNFQFTHFAIDRMIAPEMSKLIACEMDDLIDWSDNLSIYLQNHMYRISAPRNYYALGLLYMVRVDEAARQYQDEKIRLKAFIPIRNNQPGKYFSVLRNFEQSIALAWQAKEIAAEIAKIFNENNKDAFRYTPGHNSIDEQINCIYNSSKHVDKDIARGLLADDNQLPIWITNTGIKSVKNFVSFAQLHEFLTTCITFARMLAVDAPQAVVDRHSNRDSPDAGS